MLQFQIALLWLSLASLTVWRATCRLQIPGHSTNKCDDVAWGPARESCRNFESIGNVALKNVSHEVINMVEDYRYRSGCGQFQKCWLAQDSPNMEPTWFTLWDDIVFEKWLPGCIIVFVRKNVGICSSLYPSYMQTWCITSATITLKLLLRWIDRLFLNCCFKRQDDCKHSFRLFGLVFIRSAIYLLQYPLPLRMTIYGIVISLVLIDSSVL